MLIVTLVSLLVVSCGDFLTFSSLLHFDRVMVLYSAGCNSLSENLESNISELKTGFVPDKNDRRALIVISHTAGDFYTNTSAYIIRIYKGRSGVVADTLKTITAGKFLTQATVMRDALDYVKQNFKSDHYGLVFSSHATGWLPEGYFNNPNAQTTGGYVISMQAPQRLQALPEDAVPYYEPQYEEGLPPVKSIGEEDSHYGESKISFEMSLTKFAENIPMHLDYLVFDACFMGCIECAYELKDVCDLMAFSPTEILAWGFQYKTLASHLLESKPDVYKACKDYFDKYDQRTGGDRAATITLVDCTKLEPLATVCKELCDKYQASIKTVNPALVQPFFRGNKHWFYDLEDVFVQAGITASEKDRLDNALDGCIVYKASTPKFLTIPINTYSGFSMYLPSNGNEYLDNFYKTLAWNKATGLVQ